MRRFSRNQGVLLFTPIMTLLFPEHHHNETRVDNYLHISTLIPSRASEAVLWKVPDTLHQMGKRVFFFFFFFWMLNIKLLLTLLNMPFLTLIYRIIFKLAGAMSVTQ